MEMQEITVGFNNMRALRVHLNEGDSHCTCGCASVCSSPPSDGPATGVVCCQAESHTYKRSTHLWKRSLCSLPEGSDWHSIKCLKGQCGECGFFLIPICDREIDPHTSTMMTWRRFEMVSAGSRTKTGEPKQVIRLEYKVTRPREFLEYAAPKMKQFVWHQHVAHWQDVQFKESVQNLKEGEILSLIDFAENYSFRNQNEIQSEHWFNFQLTILVHITYQVNSDWNPLDPQSKRLHTDYNYYISDDRVHDSLFVQHCLTLHWKALVSSGRCPVRHIVWSDGCAAQFKGAKAWFYVSRYVQSMIFSWHDQIHSVQLLFVLGAHID